MRVIHLQPTIPSYRLDFFNKLFFVYKAKLKVYYSSGSLGVLTEDPVPNSWAVKIGEIKTLPFGLLWQHGAVKIKLYKNDILVLSGNPRYLSTLLLLFKAQILGVRVIWWGHYWSSTSKRWRQLLRFIPMLSANAILFYTDDEVEQFRKSFKKISSFRYLCALNNGLDTTKIKQYREEYFADKRNKEILFIGRLTEKSNFPLLLRALHQINSENLILNVIGDGEFQQQYQLLSVELGLNKKINWHKGTTDEMKISSIANKCVLFVYPGDVGLSLIHSMAYGLPSLVHDRKSMHMPEIAAFKNGKTGFNFSYNNSFDLANLITKMLNDSKLLNFYSRNATECIDSAYNTTSMANRFISLIDHFGSRQ